MELKVKDIVLETFTNTSGYTLYLALKPFFINDQKIYVSFDTCGSTSSSFLNSSFGQLIEEFGYSKFTELITPKDLTVIQAQLLKKHISSYKLTVV